MPKRCLNYESGEYEYIDRDGFSITRGEYVYNWDDSEYLREEEEERQYEEERQREEEEERRREEEEENEWQCEAEDW